MPLPQQLELLKHLVLELLTPRHDTRVPEPDLVMTNPEKTAAFQAAGREDGIIAPTYLFHTLQLSRLIRPGDLVLDLACGPANQLAQVARVHPQAQFVGVDASESMLQLAQETRLRHGLGNVRFESGFIQDLHFVPDHSVDVVMSTMSLHHLPDYRTLAAVFKEAARVVKPGGSLYFADFGRLKRDKTRRFFAYQHAAHQLDLFTADYLNSLRAAFTVQEFKRAMTACGNGARLHSTALVPFMVVVAKGEHHTVPAATLEQCATIYASLARPQQRDFEDLTRFFGLGGLTHPPFTKG